MNSQQETTPVIISSVILASPNDWDEWIEVIKSKANNNRLWKYVDPSTPETELPKLEEPVRASPKDANSRGKTKLSELDEEEKEELRTLKLDHRDNVKLYRKQLSALDTLRSHILSSISRTYLVYTFKCDTTYDVLVSLKQRIAPSDHARKLQIATQYARLKEAPWNQNFEVWLQEWERVYTECKELKLPEVDGSRSVTDFVYAVESITPSWSEYWKNELDKREWEKKTLPTFFELVEIYRNHRRRELAQKGNNPQGSFAVTFKDELSDLKPESSANEQKKEGQQVPQCLCGKHHYYNKCWYIVESNPRPSWFKPSDKIQKEVDEKIANATPEIKAHIEQIKKEDQANNKDDQANKKPKDGNNQSSQGPTGVFAVHQRGTFNLASKYELRDSVLLDSGTNLHVFNNRARFVSEIEPTSDQLYAGSHTEEIVGYGTATVTIDHPDGKRQILLTGAAFVPSFHTNLVCLQKLNDKGVYWNNKENTLFYGDNETYAHCGYHDGQKTIEYNEPKRASCEASIATQLSKRTPTSKIANQGIAVKSLALNTLEQNGSAERSGGVSMSEDKDETQVDIGGSRQVDSGGNQDQATDREVNHQDDDVISPQASKDDLPTPILTPEPQSNITTTESLSSSTNQKPQLKYIPVENRLADAGEEAIKHLPQSVTGPILNGPTTVKSTTCGVSKAHKIALRRPPKRRLRWQTSRKKKLKALKGELNKQTARQRLYLTKSDAELNTKLRHVDIHLHWLRQEVREGSINIKWMPTADMTANGSTKALPRQKHETFVQQLNLIDIKNLIRFG